jgi:hypothetical protein
MTDSQNVICRKIDSKGIITRKKKYWQEEKQRGLLPAVSP